MDTMTITQLTARINALEVWSDNTFQYGGLTLRLEYDSAAPCPFDDGDSFLSHLSLAENFDGELDELKAVLDGNANVKHLMPVHLMNDVLTTHVPVKMDGWLPFSKHVGFVWTTDERLDEMGWDAEVNDLAGIYNTELENYSAWANGEVYSLTVTDCDGTVLESIGGFYALTSDDTDDFHSEAVGAFLRALTDPLHAMRRIAHYMMASMTAMDELAMLAVRTTP